MSITLIGRDHVPLQAIAEYLNQQRIGHPVLTVSVREVLRGGNLPEDSTLTFLVSLTQNFLEEGDAVAQVRLKLRSDAKLILCMPRPTELGAQTLFDLGVNEIISPAEVNAESVGERILAHLIQHGEVQPNTCEALRGGTLQMRNIFADIERYALVKEAVIIRGETGTGKGLVAEALHLIARRAGQCTGQFITIVCAGLPPELLASDLFGYVEGAFTGAKGRRAGLIESANDGTAFIDEIGDLDSTSQIKLLRLLENRLFLPVGSDSEKKASARFVLATHCNLEERLTNGSFREDLYARINRIVVELPSLRERRADIPLLVDHLLRRYNDKNETSVDLATGAVDELFRYDWPLNVRELDDVVCRAASKVIPDGIITDTMLRESIRDPRKFLSVNNKNNNRYTNLVGFDPAADLWSDVEDRTRREYLKALVRIAKNIDHAVNLSGIGRSQLYKYLNLYSLSLKSQ